MNWRESLDRFELYDEPIVHQEIQEAAANGMSLVSDRDRHLPVERNATQLELDVERITIDGLEKPRPKLAVHMKRSVHHHARNAVDSIIGFSEHTPIDRPRKKLSTKRRRPLLVERAC